jgi:hypothetical protein
VLPSFIEENSSAVGTMSVRCFEGKESSEIMTTQIISESMAVFQQIFAAFCVLIADLCILLFFQNFASKLLQLLITNAAPESQKTNLFKRTLIQMSLYGHLTTSHSRQKTNFLKPKPKKAGDCAETNQFQRKFLFNNCIQS